MQKINKNKRTVILNIGTGKFFLHQTAEVLSDLGLLAGSISGIVKLPRILSLLKLKNFAKLQRLQNRMSALDQDVKQIQVLSGEFYWQIATFLAKFKTLQSHSRFFYFFAARRFDIAAQKFITKNFNSPDFIYHFRAGFGGDSIKLAKELGIKTICDHSITHPNYNWWTKESLKTKAFNRFDISNLILNDINEAEHLIVNSVFVANTFRICGDMRPLNIMTPPIDKKFLSSVVIEKRSTREGVTFVGKCEFRKGIDVLTEIIMNLPPEMSVNVIGAWSPEAAVYYARLKEKSNVNILPYQSANEVARILRQSLVFLFPSRAEGSARVVGEAMHMGCIPLITRASGVPIKPESGYLIDDLNPAEVANLILEISTNIKKQLTMSQLAKVTIHEIENSYYPKLTKLYEVINNGYLND